MKKSTIVILLCVSGFAMLACATLGVIQVVWGFTQHWPGYWVSAVIAFLCSGINVPFVIIRIEQLQELAQQKRDIGKSAEALSREE